MPRDAVDEAVEAAGKGAKRKGGKLPPHVMVYFAMALALFAEEDYEETWTRLSETLADWGCWDDSRGTVTTGGLTQARQRLGHEPVNRCSRRSRCRPRPRTWRVRSWGRGGR
ncbi:MAG: transposase domain-containing protein [Streptosporangiaceae bacterium]